MIEIFLLSLFIFLLFLILMSIGLFFRRPPLKGSCGGLGRITGEDCLFCTRPEKEKCQKKSSSTQEFSL